MRLYVLRHGKTEWNALCKVQGTADIPLAEEGITLARQVGKALQSVPFDLCYTSPLTRARQTAELVLGSRAEIIPVIPDKRIQEIDFGILEGTRFKDEKGNILNEEMRRFFQEPQNFQRPEQGENLRDVLKRTGEFWKELVCDPSHQDQTILIASHGCAVRALLQNVYQDDLAHFWHGCVPPNCSINLVEIRHGKTVLLEEDRIYR